MKGSSVGAALRIRVLMVFSVAFITGAVLIFGLASLAGVVFRSAGLPLMWRLGFAISGMVALAFIDLLAIRQGGYCPLGLRRQTPKALMRQLPPATVAAIWGFDTGLAVSTFRVSAITWGALLMAGLGLSPWWIGLGYGVGFVLPFMILLLTQTPDRDPDARASFGLRLQGLLRKRAILQTGSAAVLLLAGALFMIRLFVS